MTDQSTLQQAFDAALAELPPKQRKFVLEYLRDLRQGAAAIRAGYSARTADVQASQILRKLKVQQAVQAGLHLHAMPEAEILYRLSAQARGSLADVTRLPPIAQGDAPPPGDEECVTPPPAVNHWQLDLALAQRTSAIHLIRKLKRTEHGDEVELYSSYDALVQLAKIRGMYKDEGILKYLDLTRLSAEQVQRIADGDDPLAVLVNIPATTRQG